MTAPRKIAVLALQDVIAFELGIPHRVFTAAGRDDSTTRYEVRVCSLDGGPVRSASGFSIQVDHGPELLEAADTVIVPTTERPGQGCGVPRAPEGLREAFARIGDRTRIVSFCTAAFLLAELGLLEGLRATTHWLLTDELQRRFPDLKVDPDVLFVDEGRILTSAGAGAAVDLCLHMVRLDWGSEVANAAARRCVLPPWREGGQAQFIDRPIPGDDQAGTGGARAWALEHLDRPLSIDELSRQANMSRRTFTRRFREETGMSPARWLTQQRVEQAKRLLESSDLSVDQIAAETGFGTAVSLRQHLRATLGVSPTVYRRTFRQNRVVMRPGPE